jgi:signal peptidase II
VRHLQAARGASLIPGDTAATEAAPVRGRVPAWVARTLVLGVLAVGFALDQLTKRWALAGLEEGEPVRLLGGLLTLRLIFNSGAAFGMGADVTIVFTLLSATVLVVLLVVLWRVRHRGWALGLGLLGAGVCGNLTDRLLRPPAPLHGHVVDFLELPYFPAVFNVADVCVTFAAITIAWVSLFGQATLRGERAT